MIPDHLAEAFRIIDDAHHAAGKPRFRWDDRLAAIAQDLADWGWSTYTAGGDYTADPHHEFLERGERHGWPSLLIHPPDSKPGIFNRSEDGATGMGGPSGKYPADPSGFSYPPRAAAEHARHNVQILTSGVLPPHEGHVWDFHTSWTHLGLGYKEGMFIMEYGYLPDEGPFSLW
jgi:hypothetical protein